MTNQTPPHPHGADGENGVTHWGPWNAHTPGATPQATAQPGSTQPLPACIEDVAAGPVAHLAHRRLDHPVAVDAAVLELVGLGVVPDVRGRDDAVDVPAVHAVRVGRGRAGC